jgi:hypothetical protein
MPAVFERVDVYKSSGSASAWRFWFTQGAKIRDASGVIGGDILIRLYRVIADFARRRHGVIAVCTKK